MNDDAARVGERNRRYGIREGAFTAVTQGAGENYLSAYAILLHATTAQVGLLAALPAFLGTLAQLFSVAWLRWFDRRQRVVVTGAAAQGLLWLPLAILPLSFPEQGPAILIACAVPYVMMGHFAIPAWNSLITDLIDPSRRGEYFALRARVMSATGFIALTLAGLLLTWAEGHGRAWAGFLGLFVLAAATRGIAARYLGKLDESVAYLGPRRDLRLHELLVRARHRPFRKFLTFSAAMHFASLVAGPYFVVYLLRDLHFGYVQYSAWAAAAIVGQFAALKGWGRIGDRFGNKKLLLASGLFIPVLPVLYLVTHDVLFILVINLLAGASWSGFNLGLQNSVFDLVQASERAGAVATSNTVNATASFLGALVGSWLGTVAPPRIAVPGLELEFVSNLAIVFLVSAVLRLGAIVLFTKPLEEPRDVTPISHRQLFHELPLIKPMMDVLGRRIGHQP